MAIVDGEILEFSTFSRKCLFRFFYFSLFKAARTPRFFGCGLGGRKQDKIKRREKKEESKKILLGVCEERDSKGETFVGRTVACLSFCFARFGGSETNYRIEERMALRFRGKDSPGAVKLEGDSVRGRRATGGSVLCSFRGSHELKAESFLGNPGCGDESRARVATWAVRWRASFWLFRCSFPFFLLCF